MWCDSTNLNENPHEMTHFKFEINLCNEKKKKDLKILKKRINGGIYLKYTLKFKSYHSWPLLYIYTSL
jgi:hypothetical protein